MGLVALTETECDFIHFVRDSKIKPKYVFGTEENLPSQIPDSILRYRNRNGNLKLRNKLFKKNNGKCSYCQKQMRMEGSNKGTLATIDHKIPLSRGGSNLEGNIVICCAKCNNKKGNKTEKEYLQKN